MNRRHFLLGAAGAALLPLLPSARLRAQQARSAGGKGIENPYGEVQWDTCRYISSMSHQHTHGSEAELQALYDMGYRHLAVSNYYPSAPTYPLPPAFLARNPEAIGCPNAEQHSFVDNGGHFNAVGSLLATGYGSEINREQRAASPVVARFENLHVFQANKRPGSGVYRLDIITREAPKAAAGGAAPTLTVEGAVECDFGPGFPAKGEVRDRPVPIGRARPLYFRAGAETMTATLNYDKAAVTVIQFRLMQGTNRAWREIFRAALDGEMVEGRREGGLLYADGGGITLNHPTQAREVYTQMLDFDPRVLGLEVWNLQTTGFGSDKGGFYDKEPGPHLHFYRLWDEILGTGRRCWGFFVKDHLPYGRGRNVLLLPDLAGLSAAEREREALRAYRNGHFFGSIAAPATEGDKVVAPYDGEAFRFTRIAVRRDAGGKPQAIEVVVAGHDAAKRPNVQIRFVTEKGTEQVTDAAQAELLLEPDNAGGPGRKFVRVEAFAYPGTHNGGEPLTKEAFRAMNVYDISLVHDKKATGGPVFFGNEQEFPAVIPTVDMIFSQPLRFLE